MSIRQGNKTIAGNGVGKANTDMDNLTSTGANIANWSLNVTNCITNIPQDIKLELNSDGQLVLKAGSKIYHPNGVGSFNTYTISNDLITNGYGTGVRQMMVFVRYNGTGLDTTGLSNTHSGSDSFSGTGIYYNTTTNNIDYYTSGTASGRNYCFPMAIITMTDTTITSIDQVFNGFGYIGSTVFALPGVKGLIPNGRNEDGSLKNTTTNDFTTVKTVQVNTSTAKIAMYVGGGLGSQTNGFELNEQENYNYDSGILTNALEVVRVIVDSSAKITSFTPKTAFHAVDYNDTEYIGRQAMPSDRYIELTFTDGGLYTAPDDGYFLLVGYKTNATMANACGIINKSTKLGTMTIPSNSSSAHSRWWLPAKKGETVNMFLYDATVVICRFIYAIGSK